VGKAGLRTLPAISLAKNPEACAHHWVAWIEGSELKSAHVHESQGTTPLRTTPIQAAELRLVAPLHTDPVPDDGSRPNGGALLWMGERDRQDSQLLSIKLTPDAATALARSPLPAPKPAWMASFVRADSKRLALIAQASGGKLSLSEIPWPGTAGSLRKLGEWKGEFVGAGITLDGENKLRGMLLLRAGPDLPLERLPFEINAPDFVGPVGRAIVRVSAEGVGAALLQDPQGPWSLFDGEKVAPLGGPFASAVSPLDIGFNDEGKPVLFSGGKDLGVRILNPDGSPLAGRH
jgi:hypothetical protein